MNRREVLLGAGVGAGLVALAGCAKLTPLAQAPKVAEGVDRETIRLRRLGIEPGAEDLAKLRRLGVEAFTERLLEADLSETDALSLRLRPIDALGVDGVTQMDLPRERVIEGLQTAAILRGAYGANQLLERLTIFWGEHFNVYARKGDGAFYRGGIEEALVRKHALGLFPELLMGFAKAPGMLAYLDNPSNLKGDPNENFARELMELHSLGVEGPYSQRDVQEVAKAFTGWTLETRFLRPKGTFRFDEEAHERGARVVLGETVPAGGVKQGEAIVARLALHPATAAHLARRLTLFFLGSPHPEIAAKAAEAFLKSRGDLRATLRPILMSEAMADAPPVLRRPFDALVASIKATGAETDAGAALRGHLRAMGQPLYEWPMPDGYPLAERAWGSGLIPRWNFARALAHGEISGTTIAEGLDPHETALRLASPEFSWS